ncbi:isocitrate lyase/phosphoenolpyruvate mutase family protein [Roseomonas sp. M0104]|uniref:Isocitrate lyase/phosphoenolpyruvate mutase family protein n=2 Tax=Teichococcus coralli TaxID=2545983 RepID=A0A845BFZ3_9PROT|nr:isocitrate lyase/phosphoenolpyruvate mutase family protein [Pseudoroseomonas coralli]
MAEANAAPGASAARSRDLHQRTGPLILANAWSIGSARKLEAMGFAAIGSSSAALAAGYGLPANQVERERVPCHAAALAAATPRPAPADLEDGFNTRPGDRAEPIRLAVAAGLAGGSMDDVTGDEARPIHDFGIAAARVAAAAGAAKSSGTGFVLTARAENFARGRPELDDTVVRLRASEAAGANVLFAPNLPTPQAVRAVCAAVSRLVNVLMGPLCPDWTLEELRAEGVRRVSRGHALAKVADDAWTAAARGVLEEGRFRYRRAVVERLGP